MAYYARADDDLAPTAIAVTASAEDPDYPAANLIAEKAANPAKQTAASAVAWVLEFASPIVPVAAALIYHYLDAALSVSIQANTVDSWGAPAFNQAFTIPAKRLDGPANQRWTISPWILLDTLPDYMGYQFWRLAIHGTNSQNVAVGRLFLPGALRRVDLFHDGDIGEADELQTIVQPTELQVETRLTIGGPRRSLSAALIGTDLNAGTAPVQEASDFRALHESTNGHSKPFLFVPFEDENDAWLVQFTSPQGQRVHRQGGYQRWDFSVKELSRGIPWP